MPLRKTRETSLKLSTSPIIRSDIIQISVPRIQKKNQKTSVSLGDLHASK